MTDDRRNLAARIAADHDRVHRHDEVAGTRDTAWAETSWDAVATAIVTPRPPLVERMLRRIGAPEVAAHLVARSPVLRPAWLVAAASVLAGAVALAVWVPAGSRALLPYLAVAPLLPVAGIAASYLDRDDAVAAIAAVAPIDPLRALLLRTAVVTVVAGGLAALAGLVVPGRPVLLWLAPAAATTGLTLLVGRFVALAVAAGIVGGAWLLLVAVTGTTGTPLALFEIPVVHLAGAAVAGIAAVLGRSHGREPT